MLFLRMPKMLIACGLVCLIFVDFGFTSSERASVLRVGSKRFTESYILGEILAQFLESHGFQVQRRFGLGGTVVASAALAKGEIDLYPEYTGTISRLILKNKGLTEFSEIQQALQKLNFLMLPTFGFNNSYALAVSLKTSQRLNLTAIGDIKGNSLRAAFSHEFIEREDGWKNLKRIYGLDIPVKVVEHNLAYLALKENKADIMEVYTTDAKAREWGFVLLEDTKSFFPSYWAVPLVRTEKANLLEELLEPLQGQLNQQEMSELNGLVELKGYTFAQAAAKFLKTKGLVTKAQTLKEKNVYLKTLQQASRHLFLTFTAVLGAILVSIPLAIFLLSRKRWARWILSGAGMLQTIPSIALLVFMIPLFGLGWAPALAALFLYSLLPILHNSYVGLSEIDPELIRSARGLGLSRWETLVHVRFPLGLPMILVGVRTAAIINIGTATLAAFIGAGGLGDPIVTGLALNDMGIVLQGAVPAALLAILTDWLFEFVSRIVRPRLV